MHEYNILAFVSIPLLGVLAQWIAWRFGFPSIIVLLSVGIIVGPIFNVIQPDYLLGELLFPTVSLSVAFILFEGGLSLQLSDLKHVGKVVRNLVTVGILVSWTLTSIFAYYLLGLSWDLSILLGSVLVVTGPTVIIPLLRFIKLDKQLSSILRWESIIMDPIAAILAVLTFEVVFLRAFQDAGSVIALMLGKTIVIGLVFGAVAAYLLVFLFRYSWIPDYLQEAFTFVLVIFAFVISNVFSEDSGLLTVTIMGILLANQQYVKVRHIVNFKEHLTILILGTLFIVLAARLELNDIVSNLNWQTFVFVFLVMFIARPLSVLVSSWGTSLKTNEMLFISSLSPRGIVAAAISSLFAIRLETIGIPNGDVIVPFTFMVIIITVLFSGVFGRLLSVRLNVVDVGASALIVVGAHAWSREMVMCLKKCGISVLMIDTNRENLLEAKALEISSMHGNIMSSAIYEEIEIGNYSRMLLLTSSDEVNLLAAVEYQYIFGNHAIYSLSSEIRSLRRMKGGLDESRANNLFGRGVTFSNISARILAGAHFQTFVVDRKYTFDELVDTFKKMLLLFIVTPDKKVIVFSEHKKPYIQSQSTLIYLG